MAEFLSRLNFGEMVGFIAITGGLLIGFVAVVGGIWSGVRKKEIAAGLKHDMLERGMSAEDIRMVLDAGKKNSGIAACDSRASYCS
jgi:hypothetical protein